MALVTDSTMRSVVLAPWAATAVDPAPETEPERAAARAADRADSIGLTLDDDALRVKASLVRVSGEAEIVYTTVF
jgi:hypothetical protein